MAPSGSWFTERQSKTHRECNGRIISEALSCCHITCPRKRVIMPLSTEGQHTTGGITVAQPKKLEVHPLCQEYETVTGTKQTHKTINSTVCGTPSCVAADKAAHFSKRWAELRISRERQWLTALLCFPLYWLWVKVADVDLLPLPILINLQQEAGRIPRAPQMRNCYSAEQKYFTGCNLSCGVVMPHICTLQLKIYSPFAHT